MFGRETVSLQVDSYITNMTGTFEMTSLKEMRLPGSSSNPLQRIVRYGGHLAQTDKA